ncbi:LPD1 domain-containing protein [Clostridium akagii]|uniref:LPD1 domain-containing protein n=1 Tax=Clostridium akagii TaxID=91623 RepID=UPI00047B922A|nr:LPD1 domain-containing protein [Clostridium akagii]
MSRTKEKIDDFGEKIGGARKDYYSKNGISVKEIEDLNHRQIIENSIKPYVFKKPDYERLVNDGIDKTVVYFLKKLYDSFPTKFTATTTDFEFDKKRAINYIELGNTCNSVFKEITSIKDFDNIRDALLENGFIIRSSNMRYKFSSEKYSCDISKFFNNLNISSYDISKAQSKIKEINFPFKVEAWRKGFVIKNYGDSFSICKKTKSYYSTVKDGFVSTADAEKYLVDVIKPEIEKDRKESRKGIEARPQLKHIRRIGEDYRNSKEISTEEFMRMFNFRGGEFGNWNTQSDRQQNLNLAYDSLLDLAKQLKISPKGISLDKTLSIAFGSRGAGNNSAHYEPGALVINLTKMRGAGSLAHEWGHALDDYYSRLSGNSKMNSFMSDGVNENSSKVPHIAKTFNELMNQLKQKYLNEDEIIEKYTERISEYQNDIKEKIIDKLKNRYNIDAQKFYGIMNKDAEIRKRSFNELENQLKNTVQDNIVTYYGNVFNRSDVGINICLNKIINAKELIGKEIDDTKYFKNAKLLDSTRSKEYFTNNKELFARAFESYIEYNIKKENKKSDYLVYGTGTSPLYVANIREQKLIFDKMDEFINQIEELGKDEIIVNNFEIVEDTYDNKDYREVKQQDVEVEKINSSVDDIANSEDGFRYSNEESINVVIPNKNGQFDLVKFNTDEKFLLVQRGIKKQDLIEYIKNDSELDIKKNTNDFLFENANNYNNSTNINLINLNKNTLISTTDDKMLVEKVSNDIDSFNIYTYDTSNKLIDVNGTVSVDNLDSIILDSSVIEISKASKDFVNNNKIVSKEFLDVKKEIDKFKDESSFEIQFKDKICQVDKLENENVYKLKSLTSNDEAQYLKEGELINKLIEEKPIEIRQDYMKVIEREIADETDRFDSLLNELNKADSFSLKNDNMDKHVLVTPSLKEQGSYQITYMYANEPISDATLNNKSAVALRLAEEGFSEKDIREMIKIEDLKIENIKNIEDIKVPLKNIDFDELKAKANGAIQVIRVKNENMKSIKNLKQDYCTYPNKDYISVVVSKAEKNKALVALGLKNEEIGKIQYTTFKQLQGINKYILMSKEEYATFKDKCPDVEYSAFIKKEAINVVIKENDLKTALEAIKRDKQETLGNTLFKEIKENGIPVYRKYERKIGSNIMKELMDKEIKFSALFKGEKYISISFDKSSEKAFDKISEKVKMDFNKTKQTER